MNNFSTKLSSLQCFCLRDSVLRTLHINYIPTPIMHMNNKFLSLSFSFHSEDSHQRRSEAINFSIFLLSINGSSIRYVNIFINYSNVLSFCSWAEVKPSVNLEFMKWNHFFAKQTKWRPRDSWDWYLGRSQAAGRLNIQRLMLLHFQFRQQQIKNAITFDWKCFFSNEF